MSEPRHIKVFLLSLDPLLTEGVPQLLNRTLIEPVRFDFEIFSSVSELQNKLTHESAEILLVDLPFQSSEKETLKQLFPKIAHRIPIVTFSGEDWAPDQESWFQIGVQDHLPKNRCDERELKKTLLFALERHRLLYKQDEWDSSRFLDIIQKSADGMMVIDADGIVVFANPAVETLFGRKVGSFMGRTFDFQNTVGTKPDDLPEGTEGLSLRYVQLLAKTEKTTEIEVSKSESERSLIEVRAKEIQWDSKIAFLLVLHDVTTLMKLQKLKHEIFEQEKVARLKDEFISTVSHEIRTPLAIVKCAVENMKDGVTGTLSEKQEKVVRIAAANVDRLSKLIDDILDLSKLEAGHVDLHAQPASLVALINDSVRRFSILAKERGIEILPQFGNSIPECQIDPDKIVQVIDNLISNGLKYAQSKILVSVNFESPQHDDDPAKVGHLMTFEEFSQNAGKLHVVIKDDGQGIPTNKLEQLFNKFVQIDRPMGGAGYKGTGLGLAISREIIELHEGEIWAESQPGQGAAFHFRLPLVLTEAANDVDQTMSLDDVNLEDLA